MAESDLKVYLENIIERVHINREELRHKGSVIPVWHDQTWPRLLSIQDLYGQSSRARLLKKPDTHRITCLWTPKECVDLLECLFLDTPVPDVILWASPDGFLYVVDGLHRLSILVAWVEDDWGDHLASEAYADESHAIASKSAAQRVRALLQERDIGFFSDYLTAYTQYEELERQLGHKPSVVEMDSVSLRYGERVRQWELGKVGLPIMWLKGDYAQAEASLLSYQAGLEKLRKLHNDVFDTPEFQAAHYKLMEKLGSEPKPAVPESEK